MGACYEIHAEYKNSLCGKNADFFLLNLAVQTTNHRAINGKYACAVCVN
jgi:hypothetical protein